MVVKLQRNLGQSVALLQLRLQQLLTLKSAHHLVGELFNFLLGFISKDVPNIRQLLRELVRLLRLLKQFDEVLEADDELLALEL